MARSKGKWSDQSAQAVEFREHRLHLPELTESQAPGSHRAGRGYEPPQGTRPPAKGDRPDSNRHHRRHGAACWTVTPQSPSSKDRVARRRFTKTANTEPPAASFGPLENRPRVTRTLMPLFPCA